MLATISCSRAFVDGHDVCVLGDRWRRPTIHTPAAAMLVRTSTIASTRRKNGWRSWRRSRSFFINPLAASSSGSGGPRGREGEGGGGSASEAAVRLQQDALDSRTKLRLANLRAQKDEERAIKERASELERELQIRAEGKRRAEEIGGRRPTQRKAVPIAIAGVQCGALAAFSYVATQRLATFLTDLDTPVANKTLLTNLSVGGGVAMTSLLVISTLILFSIAWKEGMGVVNNTPVTFYRCDGVGPNCCKNGPHNLGHNKKFVYLSNGRGFETRQKDSMRRHLIVSKKCRELKPIVVYPKEEGWELW